MAEVSQRRKRRAVRGAETNPAASLRRLTTERNETYTLSYRLKDLEARLDPALFVRLGQGALANLEMLRRVSAMPGGTYVSTLSNGQQLSISRLQGRILRGHLIKL